MLTFRVKTRIFLMDNSLKNEMLPFLFSLRLYIDHIPGFYSVSLPQTGSCTDPKKVCFVHKHQTLSGSSKRGGITCPARDGLCAECEV